MHPMADLYDMLFRLAQGSDVVRIHPGALVQVPEGAAARQLVTIASLQGVGQ